MKRLMFLVLAVVLTATACSSDTQIDAAAAGDAVDSSDSSENAAQDTSSETDDADSGDASASPAPTAPAATPAATATSVPEAANDGAEPDTDAETEPEPQVTPDAEVAERLEAIVLSDDWCEAAVTMDDSFDDLEVINPTNPQALAATYTQIVSMLGQIQEIAPDEISADVSQTLSGFETFAGALEDANWSIIDVDLSVISQLDAPMAQATYNIEKYNFEVCGIDNGFDPNSQPGDDTTSPAPSDLPEDLETARQLALDALLDVGFSNEEANCFIEALGVPDANALADGQAVLAIFEECGISLDRLADLGG